MLLYDSAPSGNCYKTRLLLSQLGISFERVEVDTRQHTNREQLLGGKNPALRVPVLELDDGRHLAESNAIMWYLADGTEYLPAEPYERAQVLQWMFFEQYEHERCIFFMKSSCVPQIVVHGCTCTCSCICNGSRIYKLVW